MPFCTAMRRVGKFDIFVSDPFVEWNHMILARKNNGFFVTLSCAFYHMTHQCFSNALFLELRIDVQSENHLIIAVRVVQRVIRDYCREFFVSKGMIADFAIHDKGDGNPHAHILLTMRAMDETGKWLRRLMLLRFAVLQRINV